MRELRADEIECRIGTVRKEGNKGFSLLLYKDARCDMAILDEEYGPMNWKCEYSRDNANCTVSIWDKDKEEWVSKEDTGTPSKSEPEKGLASDSFKRACVKWGIGRELYTSPFIWIKGEVDKTANYKVTHIGYDFHRISELVIVESRSGECVYTYGMSTERVDKEHASESLKIKREIESWCEHKGFDLYQKLEEFHYNKSMLSEELSVMFSDMKDMYGL